MNAQTLLLTLTATESVTTDRVYNAERVLFTLKRLRRKPGFNSYIVRSAIRKQKKFVEKLRKEYE